MKTNFVYNTARWGRTVYDAVKVEKVEAKTVTNKWALGGSVTTVFFIFADTSKRLKLTDTRNPFSPVSSGYSDKEVSAILEWLSYVPESVEGYSHVIHLQQALNIKHS